MIRHSLFAIVLTTCFSTPLLFAQDYQKDFAKSPLQDRRSDPEAPTVLKEPPARPSPIPSRPESNRFKSLEPAAPTATPASALDRFTPRKALSISAILSADDQENLTKKLSDLSTVAKDTKLPVLSVYVVGDPVKVAPAVEKLMQLDDSGRLLFEVSEAIKQTTTLPEKYKISTTPAWIVETEEGEVLLEGAQELGKYFDRNGQFLEPVQ